MPSSIKVSLLPNLGRSDTLMLDGIQLHLVGKRLFAGQDGLPLQIGVHHYDHRFIVRQLPDDEAVIAMVDANLQRETILPSEKAFAYKMKLDAIKHQGVTSAQVGQKLLSVEKVADDAGESRNQIKRYIRLTYLIPELLSMVDDGKIAFNPAVELSYLDSYQQRAVLDAMALNDCTPSHAQSIRLKKLAQEGVLDDQIVYAVLAETKPNQQEQLKFKREELRKYFPSGYTEEQMRRDIIKGLELLKRQRERNRDAR